MLSAILMGDLGNSLKVSTSVPELVRLNDGFWLNCTHRQRSWEAQLAVDGIHQSGDLRDIYAIKWYKDDEEFYRFLPNAEQRERVSIYETNGVQLDVSYTPPNTELTHWAHCRVASAGEPSAAVLAVAHQ